MAALMRLSAPAGLKACSYERASYVVAGLQACPSSVVGGLQACPRFVAAGLQACQSSVVAGLQACPPPVGGWRRLRGSRRGHPRASGPAPPTRVSAPDAA